jgi:hypothetical protein
MTTPPMDSTLPDGSEPTMYDALMHRLNQEMSRILAANGSFYLDAIERCNACIADLVKQIAGLVKQIAGLVETIADQGRQLVDLRAQINTLQQTLYAQGHVNARLAARLAAVEGDSPPKEAP